MTPHPFTTAMTTLGAAIIELGDLEAHGGGQDPALADRHHQATQAVVGAAIDAYTAHPAQRCQREKCPRWEGSDDDCGGCWIETGLTDTEHHALMLTGQLAGYLRAIITAGGGPTIEADWAEAAHEIHTVQQRIMAQAAARAYPDAYRLMGATLRTKEHGG